MYLRSLNAPGMAWKHVHTFSGVISAVFITAFAVPFIGAEVVVFGMFAQQTSWLFPLMIIVIIAINWLFYELLKAPTRAGRKLLDKIEGFKNYIEVAEKHDLQYKYAGGKTPELFERLLPYAIALGIEKTWGDQFEAELQQAADISTAYRPAWYHGRHWNVHNVRGFTSAMGSSLSSAVASAATAPGSSSGSGGGGFSGGGGGGGGGGGW